MSDCAVLIKIAEAFTCLFTRVHSKRYISQDKTQSISVAAREILFDLSVANRLPGTSLARVSPPTGKEVY